MNNVVKRKRAYTVPKTPVTKDKVVTVEDSPRLSATEGSSRSMSYLVDIYNFTGKTLTTKNHTGLIVTHPPTKTTPTNHKLIGCLVIDIGYRVHHKSNVLVNETTDPLGGGDCDIIDRMSERLNVSDASGYSRHVKNIPTHSRTTNTMIGIPLRYLNELGTTYVREVDMVVSVEENIDNYLHPNSEEYIAHVMDSLYSKAHTLTVEINESQPSGDLYYTSLCGVVQTITPSSMRDEGDFFKIMYKESGKPNKVIATGEKDDETLAKHGIFKNYRDADNYVRRFELQQAELARETAVMKAEAERRQHSNNLASSQTKSSLEAESYKLKLAEVEKKAELLEQQAKMDRAKIEAGREKLETDRLRQAQELEYEREKQRRDFENQRMKDYYESRTYNRKDSSEALKFLPVLVGGAIAALSLIKR